MREGHAKGTIAQQTTYKEIEMQNTEGRAEALGRYIETYRVVREWDLVHEYRVGEGTQFSRFLQRDQDTVLYENKASRSFDEAITIPGEEFPVLASPTTATTAAIGVQVKKTAVPEAKKEGVGQVPPPSLDMDELPNQLSCTMVRRKQDDETVQLTSICCQYCYHEHIIRSYEESWRPGEC
uniref:Ribonucleoside-diphosphate reductase subunit beta n=1 Tax=Lygus hesperus TaxID=30085 RepID=A0A0A9XFM5_LYGHE